MDAVAQLSHQTVARRDPILDAGLLGNEARNRLGPNARGVIGIGYDISPEMALLAGRGFYRGITSDGMGGFMDTDSDSSFFFGVSLNLNAFRELLSGVAQQYE